ncbi:hypothetical protein [Fictibacillus barbaricus]|uniref:Uncharacterized protein n=1 Tax=Fictibacillus barbaricus TaxID=182136 RepID=A0ABU1TXG3_9BACL|nr:hypothetical protein [Fictibacillus barbaricus]MDR7071863.1 hypothetical protein [Fictibacillus barbaricus]
MKWFFNLNILSAFFGFIFFCTIELMLNTYRISNAAGININHYEKYSPFIYISFFVLSTILLLIIEKYWIGFRKTNFWAAGLWIPYSLIFIFLFNIVLPFTDPADVPGPGAGILLMFSILFYPFYVATIIGVGMGFDAE